MLCMAAGLPLSQHHQEGLGFRADEADEAAKEAGGTAPSWVLLPGATGAPTFFMEGQAMPV